MVERKYDRERIDRRTREILRALAARNIDYVTSARIRKEFDEDIAHQKLRPTIERLADSGDLERWQDEQPSGQSTYRIALEYDCHYPGCERTHDSMRQALVCCAEQFGDEPASGSVSATGPAAGMVDHLEGGEQR